jgi:hypothetical protein
MKYIITFLKKCISKDVPKPVGRWRIENCDSQLNRKIDLSNEDHCGPCGQYILEKTEVKNPSNTSCTMTPTSSLRTMPEKNKN